MTHQHKETLVKLLVFIAVFIVLEPTATAQRGPAIYAKLDNPARSVGAQVVSTISSVHIEWSDVASPSDLDYIGVFSPAYNPEQRDNLDSSPRNHGYRSSPAQQQKGSTPYEKNLLYPIPVNRSASWRQGFGKLSFNIANMRTNYNFGYFSGIARNNTVTQDILLTVSNEIEVDPSYPTQGHLALTNQDSSSVLVMWVSDSEFKPQVFWGNQTSFQITDATSYTYKADDMKDCTTNGTSEAINRFRDPGWLHAALLSNLNPRSNYYYYFGTTYNHSSKFTFVSPPLVGPESPVKFAVYADQGTSLCVDTTGGWCGLGVSCVIDYLREKLTIKTGEEPSLHPYLQQQLQQQLQQRQQQIHENNNNNKQQQQRQREEQNNIIVEEQPFVPSPLDFLLAVGDLSYAVGRAYRWDMFMNEIEPIAAKIPFMVVLGNHEYDYIGQVFAPTWSNYYNDSDGECGIPTKQRFIMPWTTETWWYSYDYGNVHIISISTEHNFTVGSPQWVWLKNDLISVKRDLTPWVIVNAHRPLYSSGLSDEDYTMSLHFREELEEVMYAYSVDVVLTGHYHNYERTWKIYKENVNPKGIMHVVLGTAGIELEKGWMEPKPTWSAFRSEKFYGHVEISTPNSTALHLEWFDCGSGNIVDDYWLFKDK